MRNFGNCRLSEILLSCAKEVLKISPAAKLKYAGQKGTAEAVGSKRRHPGEFSGADEVQVARQSSQEGLPHEAKKHSTSSITSMGEADTCSDSLQSSRGGLHD